MADLIDRQMAIDEIYKLMTPPWAKDGDYNHTSPRQIEECLNKLPSAQTEGEWIRLQGDSRFMCSVCKWKEDVPTCMGEPSIWDYCPSCGARMRGASNGTH